MDMRKTGRFLQALRKEKGLTQAELGDILHTTGKTVSRWETGLYMPPVEMLLQLSEFYGVNMNELVNGERIAPQDIPVKAEAALTAALRDAPFLLQERQRYWRQKWLREHRGLLALYGFTMAGLAVIALKWESVGLLALEIGAIVSIVFAAGMNNAREGYVEHHLYDE